MSPNPQDGPFPAAGDARRRELDALRERLLRQPKDAGALARAATLLQDMGRFAEAAAHVERALAIWREASDAVRSGQALLQLANCHAAAGDYRQAEASCQAALALAPEEPAAYLALATLAFDRGQVDKAGRLFRVARELHPGSSEACAGLAMIHQRQGECEQAFDLYLRSLELDGDNLVALLGLFQTSCQMGDFSKIIHYLEIFLDGHPTDAAVLFCLATLYARQGRLGEARQATLRVLAEEPGNSAAAALLAELAEALAGAACG